MQTRRPTKEKELDAKLLLMLFKEKEKTKNSGHVPTDIWAIISFVVSM